MDAEANEHSGERDRCEHDDRMDAEANKHSVREELKLPGEQDDRMDAMAAGIVARKDMTWAEDNSTYKSNYALCRSLVKAKCKANERSAECNRLAVVVELEGAREEFMVTCAQLKLAGKHADRIDHAKISRLARTNGDEDEMSVSATAETVKVCTESVETVKAHLLGVETTEGSEVNLRQSTHNPYPLLPTPAVGNTIDIDVMPGGINHCGGDFVLNHLQLQQYEMAGRMPLFVMAPGKIIVFPGADLYHCTTEHDSVESRLENCKAHISLQFRCLFQF